MSPIPAADTDEYLLEAFAAAGAEAPFAELIRRHGPLVFNTCLRTLRDPHAAEDAAQAVFLTLAHKARDRSLRAHGVLPGWLHRTAWHIASRAREAAWIRRRHEEESAKMKEQKASSSPDRSGLLDALDQALNAVPDGYRRPIVLHHLEGQPVAEIAARMGCSVNAIKLKLSRGREKLRARLVRHGVTCAPRILETLAPEQLAMVALPATLLGPTVKVGSLIVLGQSAASEAVSAEVTQLTQGALKMLFMEKLKAAGLVFAACAFLCVAGAATLRAMAAEPKPAEVVGGEKGGAAPGKEGLAPRRCRIVSYGADMGCGIYRGKMSRACWPKAVDVDGDGKTDDDAIGGWPFSLTEPLSAPANNHYDLNQPSAVFYGGLIARWANARPKVSEEKLGLPEGFMNTNHEFRDDWNLMANPGPLADRPPDLAQAVQGFWFWRKEEFLNGGDRCKVTFDDASWLGPHISRYWGGPDWGRWVVRDGPRFFVSEVTFEGVRKSHILHPTQTRWAPYAPSTEDLAFDPKSAAWEKHNFEDVTALGFLLIQSLAPSKSTHLNAGLPGGETFAIKWYAFACEAVVTRPDTPSFHVPMARLPETAFYAAIRELEYPVWRHVYRAKVTNQSLQDLQVPGYIFRNDGDPGAAVQLTGAVEGTEPVTGVTWYDAVLWCNGLSELEGRTPCYYTDEAYTKILRAVCDREDLARRDWVPEVHWKQDADGFRLPSRAESALLQRQAGTLGLKGTESGPWEFMWDVAGNTVKAESAEHAVAGGGKPPIAAPGWAPMRPWQGCASIGIRVVCGPPLAGEPGAGALWSFDKETVLPAAEPLDPAAWKERALSGLEFVRFADAGALPKTMAFIGRDAFEAPPSAEPYGLEVAKHEITYARWALVRAWALGHGYVFNRTGACGSLDDRPGKFRHQSNEPVTRITWWDTLVWCNALSELAGRRPVYYADEAGAEPLRKAWLYRIETWQGKGTPVEAWKGVRIHADPAADGFRLLDVKEWESIAGDPKTANPANEWLEANAAGQTHPVGILPPHPSGLCDAFGNASEWLWRSGWASLGGRPMAYADYLAPRIAQEFFLRGEHETTGWHWMGFRVARRAP